MFVRIWLYSVDEPNRARFEAAYGSDGDWARLFALGDGYLGTELLKGGTGKYLTIDRWRDEADWQAFMSRNGPAYRALDSAFEDLTVDESEIGAFSPSA